MVTNAEAEQYYEDEARALSAEYLIDSMGEEEILTPKATTVYPDDKVFAITNPR